jgi:hypothetical protein
VAEILQRLAEDQDARVAEDGELRIVEDPPAIVSVTPSESGRGSTLDLAVVGSLTNWVNGTTAITFSPSSGITVNSTTVSDATHLTVNITIDVTAVAGFRDVIATTTAEVATLMNGFDVGAAARVSSFPVEVMASGDPQARVSSFPIEIVAAGDPSARISSFAIEVMVRDEASIESPPPAVTGSGIAEIPGTGGPITAPLPVVFGFGTSPCQSRRGRLVTPQGNYLITSDGAYIRALIPAPNTTCATGTIVLPVCLPYEDWLDTTDAPTDAVSPSCGSSEHAVWYAVTVPAGVRRMTFSVFGSDYGATVPAISVWRGTCGSLVQIACGADGYSLKASVIPGETVYVMVSARDAGAEGPFQLKFTAEAGRASLENQGEVPLVWVEITTRLSTAESE